jgi:GNAT superfamily N-acetyltransferase
LEGFHCALIWDRPSGIIEEMIRQHLTDALSTGTAHGVGLWDDNGELCGIAAWRINEDAWHCAVLAVRPDARRQGHGRRLKAHVLAEARRAGARAVISAVHEDSDAMLHVNETLGARFTRDPRHGDYLVCVIPLP